MCYKYNSSCLIALHKLWIHYAQLAMLNMQAANNRTNPRLTCHRSRAFPPLRWFTVRPHALADAGLPTTAIFHFGAGSVYSIVKCVTRNFKLKIRALTVILYNHWPRFNYCSCYKLVSVCLCVFIACE